MSKKVRERLAHHGFIEEAIVDTLNDNNEQSFHQLDKVLTVPILTNIVNLFILTIAM
jgi:hypothetical protein